MLHPIKVPSCAPALEWLVQVQQDILTKLCSPITTKTIITPEWAAAIRPDCASWLKKFARRTYKNRTLLSSMQTIAAASPTQKRAIVSHFRISQLFAEAFDPAIVTPTTLSSIDS